MDKSDSGRILQVIGERGRRGDWNEEAGQRLLWEPVHIAFAPNLVCAIQFDADGNPWMASGQDGQFLKLTRDGRVIGAVGNGMGIGHGQFIEASYWVFDSENNMYAGDTSVSRVTKMLAPK